MPTNRSAYLVLAFTLMSGAAVAQGDRPAGLSGCTVPAAPSAEQPCHHQLARLGLDGVEAVTDMQLPAAESLQVAMFDLNGAVVISAAEVTVMAFRDAGTAVAAGEPSPVGDVEATGSIGPQDAPQ
jgi:hypothetical protein